MMNTLFNTFRQGKISDKISLCMTFEKQERTFYHEKYLLFRSRISKGFILSFKLSPFLQ